MLNTDRTSTPISTGFAIEATGTSNDQLHHSRVCDWSECTWMNPSLCCTPAVLTHVRSGEHICNRLRFTLPFRIRVPSKSAFRAINHHFFTDLKDNVSSVFRTGSLRRAFREGCRRRRAAWMNRWNMSEAPFSLGVKHIRIIAIAYRRWAPSAQTLLSCLEPQNVRVPPPCTFARDDRWDRIVDQNFR